MLVATKKAMTLTGHVNVAATILIELHLNPRHYDRLNNRNSVNPAIAGNTGAHNT